MRTEIALQVAEGEPPRRVLENAEDGPAISRKFSFTEDTDKIHQLRLNDVIYLSYQLGPRSRGATNSRKEKPLSRTTADEAVSATVAKNRFSGP